MERNPGSTSPHLIPHSAALHAGYSLGKHDANAPAKEAARKILSHKKSSWAYEREWRIFGPPGELYFAGNCIAEIRLGSRISDSHKDILLANFSSSIRIYQMTVEKLRTSLEAPKSEYPLNAVELYLTALK